VIHRRNRFLRFDFFRQLLQPVGEIILKKQKKQIPEFIALLTNTGKSEFTLDWLKKEFLKKE